MRHLILFIFLFFSLQAHELNKVSLQLQWKYQFQFAGYIIAKEKGFYEEKNLEVDIKEWSHGINMVDEVINGNSEFTISRPTSMVDISKGKDIIYLATIFQSSPLILLSDKSRNITSIQEFKGKRIMTTGDLNTDTSLISMMFSQGIDIESLKIQAPSFNPKDLLDGKTDLMASYISNEPFVLKELGGSPIIFSPRDYGFNFYNDMVTTSRKYLKENPKIVEDFRAQTLKGWEYAFANIEQSVDIIFNKYNSQNKSKAALRYEANKLKELAYYQSDKIGKIEKNKLEKIYDTYKLLGLVKNNIDFDKIIYKNGLADLKLSKEETEYLNSKEYLTVMSHDSFHPFSFRKQDEPRGYSVDIINLMGETLNKKIKFIKKPWDEQFKMLQDGNLDIIPHVAITAERKKVIEYTNFEHATFLIGFTTAKTNKLESMNDLKNKKLAVINKYYLHEHLEKNFPHLDLYIVNSTEEAINAVATGKAYAAIDNIPTLNYFIEEQWLSNLKIVTVKDLGIPLKTQVFMGVTKGNTLLKSILEKTNALLPKDEVLKIKNRWISNGNLGKNQLTNEEKEFIQNKKTIKFLIRTSRPPFEFEEDGKAKGIAVDYIKEVTKKVGLKAEFIIKETSLKETYDLMINGTDEFDTIPFTVKNKKRMEDFSFGDSYLSYPMMIITHKKSPYIGSLSNLIGKKVAIEKSFLTNKWIKRDYPNIQIIQARDTTEALRMVNDELVDAYVGNIAVANYMLMHWGFENLKIAAPTPYGSVNYNFVAPKKLSILTSILSKGYGKISPKEHNAIQQKWFSMQTVERIDYELVWKILIGASIIIIWFIWWNQKLRLAKNDVEQAHLLLEEKNKELEQISNTDRLTNIANRMSLEGSLEHEFNRAKRYDAIFGVIIIDIDHFKKINDRYGHLIGDKFLIEFSNILKTNIRNTDIVGRWGGEEFIVLCPNTNEEGTSQLAKHLRKKIEETQFSTVKNKTASFGVSVYQGDDLIEDIIKRADDALYMAKENGRNQVITK